MAALYTAEAGERLVLDQSRHFLEKSPPPDEQIRLPTCEGETLNHADGMAAIYC